MREDEYSPDSLTWKKIAHHHSRHIQVVFRSYSADVIPTDSDCSDGWNQVFYPIWHALGSSSSIEDLRGGHAGRAERGHCDRRARRFLAYVLGSFDGCPTRRQTGRGIAWSKCPLYHFDINLFRLGGIRRRYYHVVSADPLGGRF